MGQSADAPKAGRSVAAAATTAVAVAGTAVAAAEVAVAGQEPEDDEQDDGVLIQAKEASVAVTHNIAPFLRAQRFFGTHSLAQVWRRDRTGESFPLSPSPTYPMPPPEKW